MVEHVAENSHELMKLLNTMQGIQMTLTRFVRYFKRRTKRKILNLLSLEFSDTQFAGKFSIETGIADS